MLVFALVIGIIGDALSGYVDSMKKGRSAVFEREHTLICGWGDKLLPVINQIALANESEGGDVIVVMADKDKEEMEMTVLGSSELCLRGSTLVFRSGSPCILDDLRRVAANKVSFPDKLSVQPCKLNRRECSRNAAAAVALCSYHRKAY